MRGVEMSSVRKSNIKKGPLWPQFKVMENVFLKIA